jgi:SAM-dependent methyltransferase
MTDERGALTRLGRTFVYHLAEEDKQQLERETTDAISSMGLGTRSRVLDVGCGAGQTLRLLSSVSPAERVGVDVNVSALLLGCRWEEPAESGVRFVYANALSLPFRDHRFSHVICRVLLNYLPQNASLQEMVRLLEPGGHLYVVVEGIGHDVARLLQSSSLRSWLCRSRDLALGFVLEATGCQPLVGDRLWAGRSFATVRRLRPVLERLGCPLSYVRVRHRVAGLPAAVDVIARKNQPITGRPSWRSTIGG